jgi:hypothetical protein
MTKIAGYRELSLDDTLKINTVKMLGNELIDYIELLGSDSSTDSRWIAIAKTHLQQACMAAVRAVAKPAGV